MPTSPKTIRIYYDKSRGLQGRCPMTLNWTDITFQSTVLISAAEASDGSILSFSYILGDACVRVSNISPYAGGVEFILHVNWDTPLNIVVTISVFKPAMPVTITDDTFAVPRITIPPGIRS